MVVSASKTEEKLIDAPATMSVIMSQAIESAPSANFAELLRSIPGVNVTQVSARDINLTQSRDRNARHGTARDARRPQPLSGFLRLRQAWDFLPVNFNEVKQVEAIRGPASAVRGANALRRRQRDQQVTARAEGMSSSFGFGGFDRPDADAGSLWSLERNVGGCTQRPLVACCSRVFSQDAFARRRAPSRPRRRLHGHDEQLSAVRNQGNDAAEVRCASTTTTRTAGQASFSGGVAGTDGIMHSGIGLLTSEAGR